MSPTESLLHIGRYTLLDKIGEGYLGAVFRGFDESLDRAVAVRILCEGIRWDTNVEKLFSEHSRAVAAIQHPGIASILDSGKEGQTYFIVMESLGGASLRSLIAQKPSMTAEAKISIMMQIAEALGYAHKKGILHRDLAPGKIHLTSDGTTKIRDFGFAHVLRRHLPHPIIRWGTPIYLSPEQVQQQDCDPRSDIFSAGTIFYELITYRHPFFNRDGNKALDNILMSHDLPTFELYPDEPPGIWPILKTCLKKNPKDRYQSMDELVDACRNLLEDLAEDCRLMLAELYAALPALKKLASQPGASQSTVHLFTEAQKFLRGEKQPDYVSLDHMMNLLLEQYPVIRVSAPSSEPTGPNDLMAKGAFIKSEVFQALSVDRREANEPAGAGGNLKGDVSSGPDGPASPEASPLLTEPERKDSTPHVVSESPQKTRLSSSEEAIDSRARCSGSAATPQHQESTIHKEDSILLPTCGNTTVPDVHVKPKPRPLYRRIRRPSYRTTAALLALLVIAAAGYIVWGAKAAASLSYFWNAYLVNYRPLTVAAGLFKSDRKTGAPTVARADTFPQPPTTTGQPWPSALPTQASAEEPFVVNGDARNPAPPPQESVARITSLIQSGRLQSAGEELSRLQKAHPGSARLAALRRQLQSMEAAARGESSHPEQDQLNMARQQREDEWSRQANGLFAAGKYAEAENVLNQWLAESPGNWAAHDLNSRIAEIQRNLKSYSTAMMEKRYHDAIQALTTAERMNPADPSMAELRRQAEARIANAKAFLSVYRLGPKGVLFLDGQPISNDGEVENVSIPIGSHLLTIESGGNPVVSKRQEFQEGQRLALVHDLDRQYMRTMVDADRELLARRKAMEEVRLFEVEHLHGAFRGSCRGSLALDYMDIAFKPASGYHGFQMPNRLLKLKINGKTITLINAADDVPFQSFKFPDERTVARFKQTWEELRSFARQTAQK